MLARCFLAGNRAIAMGSPIGQRTLSRWGVPPWAADSSSEARTRLTATVHLRREFENPGPALKTVASRLSRGAYERSERPSEPSVTDSRGRVVRSVGKTQTSLSAAEVDELVALYEQGMTLAQLGERFGVYHRTVAAHLVRRSVPMRVRGLAEEHTCEAVRLYEGGMTLMEVGLHFGVSQGAVKRAVAAAGATVRPRGRRVAVTE